MKTKTCFSKGKQRNRTRISIHLLFRRGVVCFDVIGTVLSSQPRVYSWRNKFREVRRNEINGQLIFVVEDNWTQLEAAADVNMPLPGARCQGKTGGNMLIDRLPRKPVQGYRVKLINRYGTRMLTIRSVRTRIPPRRKLKLRSDQSAWSLELACQDGLPSFLVVVVHG